MTTEQKAKAYDEALERARKIHSEIVNNELLGFPEQIEDIFPQLRESEDEKIRKEIIDIVEAYRANCVYEGTHRFDDCLAWLEKQKENPKNADSIPSDCTSDAKCENSWHKVADSLPDNPREVLCKDEAGNFFIGRYYIGEGWEISNYDDEDKPHHLNPPVSKWTDFPSERQKDSLHVPEACKENADSLTNACKDVILAIKKYLDWLTGYPDYAPKGKYSIRDMLYCLSILERPKVNTEGDFGRGYDCGYQVGYAVAVNEMKPKVATATLDSEKQKEQKQEWSEVELEFRGEKVNVKRPFFRDDNGRGYSTTEQDDEVTWNALRAWAESHGYTPFELYPKTEWSEEDETSIAVKNPEAYKIGFTDGEAYAKEQAEWSEEDEDMRLEAIRVLVSGCERYRKESGCLPSWHKVINWLKSLRPSWRPGKEQLEALRIAMYRNDSIGYNLRQLYEHLKKL